MCLFEEHLLTFADLWPLVLLILLLEFWVFQFIVSSTVLSCKWKQLFLAKYFFLLNFLLSGKKYYEKIWALSIFFFTSSETGVLQGPRYLELMT